MEADKTVSISIKTNQPFKINPEDPSEKLVTPSWAEAHKYAAEALKWSEVAESLAKDLATAQKNVSDNTFEAFRRAPAVDCSFAESPVGPKRQLFYMKAFLKKVGWPGITNRDVQVPLVDIEPYFEVMAKNMKWIFKLETKKSK